MFIELQTRADGYSEFQRTLLRSTSIVLVREPKTNSEGGAEIVLADGTGQLICTESVDEVFSRIRQSESSNGLGYSVTMEGTGFSTTATGTAR